VGGKAQHAAYRAVAGDLKLAYAQFEELETFARFGARLDEDTRQSIAHGQRIRACLGQSELSPVSVPAQIAILLALNAALFDPVPLPQMAAAQQAVQATANALPDALVERLATADQLSDADRAQVTEAARQSIARFLPQAEPDPPPPVARPGPTPEEST
jgi:F-type H+/Na+-transporting ATPase subunit alpha